MPDTDTTAKQTMLTPAEIENFPLHLRHWPCVPARAAVVLVHGLGEHIGRYDHLARFFNEHAMAVVGYDQRGHGKSPGKRGHCPDLRTLLDDIQATIEFTIKNYPDTPLFLYGHSMGGNLVLNYALRRRPGLSGIITSGAWIRLPEKPPAHMLLLGRIMNAIQPTYTQSNGIDTNMLSRDPQIVESYEQDPLVHDRISARTAIHLLRGADRLDRYIGGLSIPVLIMHGAADKITDPDGSATFAENLETDATLKLWPDLYHELHNEPEKEEVMRYTLNWVEEHLK